MCGIFFCTSLFLILNRHLTYWHILSLYKPSVCQGLKDTMLPTFETSFNATVMVIQVKRSIYHSLMWLRLSVQIILNCRKKREKQLYTFYIILYMLISRTVSKLSENDPTAFSMKATWNSKILQHFISRRAKSHPKVLCMCLSVKN